MQADSIFALNERISVQAILVPHRDEYSETVGFKVIGPKKKLLFIPDINKWNLWERDIKSEVKTVDYAFLDGTFFEDGEIPGRNMNEIPHPFIRESMEVFDALKMEDRNKIHFIHFNHTNPLLQNPKTQKAIEDEGYGIAREMKAYSL